jgi:hypothetical protein
MEMRSPGYATKFDQLSFCYIDLKGVGTTKRHATGFFWRHGQTVYLVTNWHVVTGKDIFTGKFMKHGWCPSSLLVHFVTHERPTLPITPAPGIPNKQFSIRQVEMPLHHEYDQPLWIQHQNCFDWNIDIAILPLIPDASGDNLNIVCVNDSRFDRMFHLVGSDVLVIGHPLSSEGGHYPLTFPVWKRGSIASEPLLPWNMRPAFLVDVRTSEGMSGSPVIRRTYGPATMADLTIADRNVVCSEFMGVYSGRLYDDERNANIGLVWYRNLIDEIIEMPANGSREWHASTVPTPFSNLGLPG